MNAFTRRLAPLAGATLLGLGLAAPAQAQVYGHTDATGDVTVSTCDDNDNCTETLAPTAKQPDIVRVVTSHTSTQVKAFVKYAELGPAGLRMHVLRVVTGSGRHLHYSFVTEDGHAVLKELDRDSGAKVACSGLVAKVDNTLNTVLLSVPRSCLGNPSYVRVGFGGAVVTAGTRWRADDAFVSGVTGDSDLKLGPSLSRY